MPEDIKSILKDFIVKVRERLSNVEVYLFGSYARGDWLRDSDIDLVVISSSFRNIDVSRRYSIVRSLLPAKVSIELLLYTPEEFKKIKEKSVVIQDAEKYWIKLL